MLDVKAVEELTEKQQKLFDDNFEFAKQLSARYPQFEDDLFSIALENLLYCVRYYREGTGASFKTYFSVAFNNAVKNYLASRAEDAGRTRSDEQELKRRILELEEAYDTLSATPFVEKYQLKDIQEEIYALRRSLQQAISPKVYSLDKPFESEESDEGAGIAELLQDFKGVSAEDQAAYSHAKDELKKVLGDRNYQVLQLLEEGYTNDEIADIVPGFNTAEGVSAVTVNKIIPALKQVLYIR